jgi:hypothetical protein
MPRKLKRLSVAPFTGDRGLSTPEIAPDSLFISFEVWACGTPWLPQSIKGARVDFQL